MGEFIAVFSFIANIVTVLAGIIALAGVVWATLSRAKLTVTSWMIPGISPNLTVTVSSTGSNPVHNLELSVGALDDNGFSMWGDGAARRSVLSRGESVTVTAHEASTTSHLSQPSASEYRHEMARGEGFYLNVQWRSPLFPWRRLSSTYAWPPSLRFASRSPLRLTGRAESRFFTRTRNQSINPSMPGFIDPKWAPARATLATDESFHALISIHRGPVLVGFGSSFQGLWWEDVQRMLDAFAANYAPRIKVVTVVTNDCPEVSEKFSTGVFPHFKVFRAGSVVGFHDGAGSIVDLEVGLAEFLR